MELAFSGEIWFWRGPAPFHFVTVPEHECRTIKAVAASVSYGWGMVPVSVQIGRTEVTTALWPKDGRYIVPVKKAVQVAEEVEVGDVVDVRLILDV